MDNFLHNPAYDPNRFLDWLQAELNLRNDAALARVLAVAPPALSNIRHGRLSVGPSLLLRVHDLTNLPARTLRQQMGLPG